MRQVTLQYKKLFPDSQIPFKKRAKDSGFDVFVHGFRGAYLHDSTKGEDLYEPLPNGEIPGASVLDVNGKVLAIILNPNERVLVGTGLACTVKTPDASLYELQVRPRSGNSWEMALDILNSPGTVDNPYTGEVKIIIRNGSNRAQTITVGDKIAQLVPMEIPDTLLEEVEELQETDRGANGLGSSGR